MLLCWGETAREALKAPGNPDYLFVKMAVKSSWSARPRGETTAMLSFTLPWGWARIHCYNLALRPIFVT